MVLFWERKRAPAFMEISQSANRGLGVQFKGVEFLPRDTTADADHKWQQPLIGRQHLPPCPNSRHRLDDRATDKAQIAMPNALYCELTYSFYIGAETGLSDDDQVRNPVRGFRYFTSGYSIIAPPPFQRMISSSSSHHYARSSVPACGAALCTAGDCKVLQSGNGEASITEAAAGFLRSHNVLMSTGSLHSPLKRPSV